MSELSRRDLLRVIGTTVLAAGTVDAAGAQQVHRMTTKARAAAGVYKPKALTAHEYATLERLTDLIVPVENGRPGALAAGAAAWIDMLASGNAELAAIYTGGIGWLDREVTQRAGTTFVSAPASEQIAMLDLIAYRKNESPGLGPGIRFFGWVRKMTVDAFYTSEIGIKDLDYQGNRPQLTFEVPVRSLEHALKKSGMA
jgi:gluconate 2-dehydrogenase gamma chain